MREGTYKRSRGQSALTDKQKILFTAGIFLASISAHLAGFFTIKGIADNGLSTFTRGIWPLFVGAAAILCIGLGILRQQILRPLLYLGGAYLGVQLVLSILMGGLAVILDQAFDLNGEVVKTTVDMIIRVIQIPLRAGICLLLMEIVMKRRVRSLGLWIKLAAAFAIYTFLQYSAGFLGDAPLLIVIRILLAGIAAVILWSYIETECGKAGEQNEK